MEPVAPVNENDILLGRGALTNVHSGNKRFRELVDKRKGAYNSAARNETKSELASELLDEIVSSGGRFLRLEEGADPSIESVVENGVWYEVDRKIALEKIKQAFRQKGGSLKRRKRTENAGEVREASLETKRNNKTATRPQNNANDGASASIPVELSPHMPSISLGSRGSPVVDYSLLLPHEASLTLPPPFCQKPPITPELTMLCLYYHQRNSRSGFSGGLQDTLLSPILYSRSLAESILRSQSSPNRHPSPVRREPNLDLEPDSDVPVLLEARSAMKQEALSTGEIVNRSDDSSSRMHRTTSSSDVDEAAMALSALVVADRPKFTAQQQEQEYASMTDDERVKALSDRFGKYVSLDSRKNKRARRDLDRSSINFLVEQMLLEIEKIPNNEKEALMEARILARAEEFSAARLVKFLRCEGMNTKLAAKRFAKYWEHRREVFGPQKYLLRMSLSEALVEDIVAIEAGVVRLLPLRDASGRHLVYLWPHRHTGDGYSSDSLLRAFWYVMEVAAKENDDIQSVFVWVSWDVETTVFDFDRKVYDRFIQYEKDCWPCQWIAMHSCCPSSIIMKIMRPVLSALTDKRSRARTVFHDVPTTQIIDVMSEYGIFKHMLPIEMGGTVVLNQREWIANRRALELEEL